MHQPPRTTSLPIRLGIMSNGDPTDGRTWSGVPTSILKHLEPMVDSVVYLPAGPVPSRRRKWEGCRKGLSRALGHRALPHFDRGHLARRVDSISDAARRESVDAVLGITVDQFIANVDLDVPLIHHSDTTFLGLEDWYPEVTNLWPAASRRGHEITREAIRRSDHSTFPSRWAANQAIEHYDAAPDRTTVIPYGCNLLNPPARDVTLRRNVETGACRLLFIGRDWIRKGGPLVLETLRILRDRGIDASLTVVGTTPPQTDLPVETIGFLNQQVTEDLERYRSLWREATFLFMPSRAETFGAVYAEAAANGVPSIALDIGGVGDAVVDGENGRLLPRESDAESCARTISELLDAPDAYERLVRSSRDRYETTLHWNVWCTSTLAILEGILEDRKKAKIR